MITGLPSDQADVMVFHAGSCTVDGAYKVTGGRVLCVTALGGTLKMAQQLAYSVVEKIHFNGAQYRKDIGYRALNH